MAARIDSEMSAPATYRNAHSGLGEIKVDTRKDLDAALEPEAHFELPNSGLRSIYKAKRRQ